MSLLQRKYQPDFQSTIGVEFSSKVVLIDHQTKVKLQIWDTAGQESFRSIIKTFYRNSHAIMLVYNIAK
jgi:Ras-related protein Rab-2A